MDEMGPVAAKSYPGHQLARVEPQAEPRRPAQRARQGIDYGRRDKGYVFGAFRPVTGEALIYSVFHLNEWLYELHISDFHEILFRFLHQLSDGNLSGGRTPCLKATRRLL